LGTADRDEAQRLCDQLNELLADEKLHSVAGRTEAKRRFDDLVVDIFYDGVVPEPIDWQQVREDAIPLPSTDEDYRTVLFLGTTGAGKTTLVRQLIGTDPKEERFPSTSTAKTTIHDTEIILASGPSFRAVVTFVDSDEVRERLNECISAAVLAAWRQAPDDEVLRRLLNHVDQRFRFSYVLGNGPFQGGDDFDEDEDELMEEDSEMLFGPGIDLEVTNSLLKDAVEDLRSIAARHGTKLRTELDATDESDERVLDELFEEDLDNLLREDEGVHSIADDLLDEIEKRFSRLGFGELNDTRRGWPISWSWECEDRAEFLREIARFSSNYAPLFGRLLTPLVNGVRVAGPFEPWWADQPRLVLLDGQGLGHTSRSTSSVSTSVSRQIYFADAVVVVDNAAQPMQAGTVAAMRELVRAGAARKLIFAFTHFDDVKGDNLPSVKARAQHVLASAENVLVAVGEDQGPFAERSLRGRIEGARVFLGGIHEVLSAETREGKQTIDQLGKLLVSIEEVALMLEPGEVRPQYDKFNVVLAARSAAERFLDTWFPRLGLASKPGIDKEHWSRIKALSRRLGEGTTDEYSDLKPVADLRRELADRLFVVLQNPVKWQGAEPVDDKKQAVFEQIAGEITRRMASLAKSRLWNERIDDWRSAYDKHGRGSTFVRARIIGHDIYQGAAPIPAEIPSPDQNTFLRQIVAEVKQAMEDAGAVLA
jgi:energy-coupling factor transporter ATP-binding protein EcfA2